LRRVAPSQRLTPLVNVRRFSGACAVALDAVARVLYVADSGNGRVRVVALDGSGAVSTLAGGGSAPVYGDAAAADGAGANATLAAPSGLAWLVSERVLLLAEAGGSRLRTINVTVRARGRLAELLLAAQIY